MVSQVGQLAIGYSLYAALIAGLIYYNFGAYIKDRTKGGILTPQRFLRFSMMAFVAFIAVGILLTKLFATQDLSQTMLMEFYGYNNVCVYFDYPPSTQVLPVCWLVVIAGMIAFAAVDTRNALHYSSYPTWLRVCTVLSNISLVIILFAFEFSLNIPPEQDMYIHTAPFLCLIVAFPVVFILQAIETDMIEGFNAKVWLGVGVFSIVSIVKGVFTSLALRRQAVSPFIGMVVDNAWVLLAIASPWLLYVNPYEQVDTKTSEAESDSSSKSLTA